MKGKKSIKLKKDEFFSRMFRLGRTLSYDDVLVKTSYSRVLPGDINLSSKFSRHVPLNIPIVSAPMDTVTRYRLAIEMAKNGGIGILDMNLAIKEQGRQLDRVKFHLLGGFIPEPICVKMDEIVEQIERWRIEKDFKFHSFPVANDDGIIVGIVTKKDFDFCLNPRKKIKDIMTKKESIISGNRNTSFEEAGKIMEKKKISTLPILDRNGKIAGMYVWDDFKRTKEGNPGGFNIDKLGRLRVGAAVGVGDEALQRTELLVRKGVDVIVIDSSHGDSKNVHNTLKEIKRNFDVDVVAGNVSEPEQAIRLAKLDVDGIRVGQGPGSSCTTRPVAGTGCIQLSAVYNCAKALRGSGIPICADGGIKFSGDIVKAIAAGADNTMMGRLFAGTEEAPGIKFMRDGKLYKQFRGMGSVGAIRDNKASRGYYDFRGDYVPQGMEGAVLYKGNLGDIIHQLIGGIRFGFGLAGAANVKELQEKADFNPMTESGRRESHPHDMDIMEEAPNYPIWRENDEG